MPVIFFAAPSWAAEGGGVFFVERTDRLVKAPGFILEDLEGRQRNLYEFRGKVVLLNFWASWCEPCREEFPSLERLSAMFRGRGFEVVAIAEDSVERARPFVKETGFTSTVLIDRYGKVKGAYNVFVIPVSVIIDREGAIKGVITGARDYSSPEAVEYFRALLE